MREFNSAEELTKAVGEDLGRTDWLSIEQSRIDQFADATDDHQWIHVDVEKAKAGPFGAPIAHGYLTLSLVNHFLPQLIAVPSASMGINYGCNKVRFPSPVPVNSRIRASAQIAEVEADHVDVFLCETMSKASEARMAATAAAETGKPVWVAWSLAENLAEDGTARLRLTFTAGHDDADIERLAGIVRERILAA